MKLGPFLFLMLMIGGLFPNEGFAQSFIIRGVVIEKGSNVRIAMAKISNIRSKTGAVSNEIGMFQLSVEMGDTLLVTKKDLIDQKVAIKNNADLVVYLTRGTTMLDEVVVKGNSKEQEMAEINRDYKRNGSFYAGKPPLILLIPFGGHPLTFFYELFGKTPAQARRFKRYYKKELTLMEIDHFFNKSLVTENTELKGKDLDKFLLDYYPPTSLTSNWNHYDAIKYIKESARRYTDTLNHKKTIMQ